MPLPITVKRVFWRFHVAKPAWARGRKFQFHWVPDMLDGMLYAGVTVFGWSILYSDQW